MALTVTLLGAMLGASSLLLAAHLACDQQPAQTPPPASAAQPAADMEYRGFCLQLQSGWQPVERFTPLFAEMAGLGANAVLITSAGFMEHAETQTIFLEARKLPSVEEYKAILQAAREAGLKPILMPIVLLAKPRGSEWRGLINPPDWDDWWRQYREFIDHFCTIAREGGADALIVGSELLSTEKYTDEWEAVIALARKHFYGGKLGYSANWDHYRPIQFWDKLDFVGMTSYYKLADEPGASVDELVARWQPIKDDVLTWQRQVGRPIVFTEVGWCSQEGAATAAWNYYHNQKATPAGLEEQRRLYEAFLRVWDRTPGVAGMLWWEWSHDPGGPGDFGYTPRNKPAEQVLREWFATYEREVPRSAASGNVQLETPQVAPQGEPPSTSAPASHEP